MFILVNGAGVKCIVKADSGSATDAAPTDELSCPNDYCTLTVSELAGVKARAYTCAVVTTEGCAAGPGGVGSVCTWKGEKSNSKKDCDCDTYESTADAEAEGEGENKSGAMGVTAAVSSILAVIAFRIFA